MTTWIGLLRAVNVGGSRPLRMQELRRVVAELGYERVRTYRQSGNLVIDATSARADEVGTDLERSIESSFGFTVTVIVRSPAQLVETRAANPFPAQGAEPGTVATVFLGRPPEPARVSALEAPAATDDRFVVDDQAVHLCCPSGFGRTKLTNAFFEKRLAVPATTRNWATVQALIELTSAD